MQPLSNIKSNLKKPEAVIFDWDGTLVDTLPGLRLAHNHVRTALGFPEWTEAQFQENLRHSARELYPNIYGDRAAEALDILYKFYAENHLKHLEVLPQARELLEFLRGAGILMAVVSNKKHEYLVREITHLGWEEFFFCVLGAGTAAKDKPAADPVFMALEKAARPLHPSQSWFAGDTETDLLAAAAAGCSAVLLTHGKDKAELIAAHKPFLVLDGCAGFVNILKS